MNNDKDQSVYVPAVIITLALFYGGEFGIPLILITIIGWIIYEGVKSAKTGSYKEIHNAKRYNEYYQKQKAIRERYGYANPVWDKEKHKYVGVEKEEYLQAMKDLNNEYAIKGSEEYEKIREREKKWGK